jgi:hypothetical protein
MLFSGCSNRCLTPHCRGILKKHTVVPQKGDEKLLLETVVMERGSPIIGSSKGKNRGSKMISPEQFFWFVALRVLVREIF